MKIKETSLFGFRINSTKFMNVSSRHESGNDILEEIGDSTG
jgi:hypothetical protein